MNDRVEAEKLFEEGKNLVPWIVNQFLSRTPHLEREDLMQLGYLGLWKACLFFDYRGKLSSLAVACIRNEIGLYLRKRDNREVMGLLSLNQELLEGEGDTFLDLLEDTADYFGFVESGIYDFIKKLSDREKLIVECQLGGLNRVSASKVIGISQSHYSRLLKRVREKYKRFISVSEVK